MTIPARLSVVTLGARDLDRLRAFYVGLGWQPTVTTDDFAAFLLGGVVLALWPIELLAHESGVGTGPPSGSTLALNVESRDEVDAVQDAWLAAGATPVREPADQPWGGRSGYVADPEGNRWEIAWAPGLVLDTRGAVTRFGDG